jgi:unsaturated chondroitin disaccharide hydrolase
MKKNSILFFILILVFHSKMFHFLHAQHLEFPVDHSLEFSRQQLHRTVVELQDSSIYGDSIYPRSTLEDGRWRPKREGHWASGFLPGSLWYMYQWTAQDIWKVWAESWTEGLERHQYRTYDHETGFIIFRSYGNGYKLTGNKSYKSVLLKAAQSLASRFNPNVGGIISFNDGRIIVDGMMMLELIFWAVKNGGNPNWQNMAVSHSLKTIENNIRGDGSCFQNVYYNLITGEVLSRGNKQGYSSSSTWSRGQAWGLYGFTMTYRETGDLRFLEVAKRMADFFIDNLPDDYVPYWDFQAPNIPAEEKDASAAAIAASGLLELSTLVINSNEVDRYRSAANKILQSLCSPAYLAEGTNSRGILLHGVGNRMNSNPVRGEVDVSLIYADHFFIEALLRNKQITTQENNLFPTVVQISQNYPNPFNTITTISYSVFINSEFVNIKVYDLLGREVENLVDVWHQPGSYSIDFEAGELASGTYYYRIRAGYFIETLRMILIR